MGKIKDSINLLESTKNEQTMANEDGYIPSAITQDDIDSSTINDNSAYHETIGNYRVIANGKYLVRVNSTNFYVFSSKKKNEENEEIDHCFS